MILQGVFMTINYWSLWWRVGAPAQLFVQGRPPVEIAVRADSDRGPTPRPYHRPLGRVPLSPCAEAYTARIPSRRRAGRVTASIACLAWPKAAGTSVSPEKAP